MHATMYIPVGDSVVGGGGVGVGIVDAEVVSVGIVPGGGVGVSIVGGGGVAVTLRFHGNDSAHCKQNNNYCTSFATISQNADCEHLVNFGTVGKLTI